VRHRIRRLGAGALVACALAAACAGRASAGAVLVVSGHGWGHGVGMSQWGAYGYARHGWDYRRILAHYYPGTELGFTAEVRVRVLLGEDESLVTVGCATPMKVSDATGRGHPLPAGTYGVGPRLVLPVVRRRVKVEHPHAAGALAERVGRPLRSPVVLDCARSPLVVDGRAYHGSVVIRSEGGRLSVVDSLPLDTYVRGVVGAEMPFRWSMAALEAQAVAARSYAVATLRPSEHWDLYPDERSQAYGGIAAEGPRTDDAVLATKGQVLTWNGTIATTYYSSSSGGRTADVRDLWPGTAAVPYLRSVPDPYDIFSPHHDWGPVAFSGDRLAAKLDLGGAVSSVRLDRSPSGRVDAVDLALASGATTRVSGKDVAAALGLRSTWFSIGRLSLDADRSRVLFGRPVVLAANASLPGVRLQRRLADGGWATLRGIGSGTRVTDHPRGTTSYRLVAPGVRGPSVAVAVVPRVRVRPLARTLLAGSVQPRASGAVTVWRRAGEGWRLVARPRLDPRGRFHTHLRLRAGSYRVAVAGDDRLAPAETLLRVTRRLLASFRR